MMAALQSAAKPKIAVRLPHDAARAILRLRKPRGARVTTFKAIRIDKSESGTRAGYADFDEKDLMERDVTVAVTHSTMNYKDGQAMTGKSPNVSRFPMTTGIDIAGTVETS